MLNKFKFVLFASILILASCNTDPSNAFEEPLSISSIQPNTTDEPSTAFEEPLSASSIQPESTTDEPSTLIESRGSSSIIIHDNVVLLTYTGNAELIDYIEIRQNGQLVETLSGCRQSNCSHDVSSLSAGTYDVEVFTTVGNSFSDQITIT